MFVRVGWESVVFIQAVRSAHANELERMDEQKGNKFNSEKERWNRCSGTFVKDGAVFGGA